MGTIYRNGHQYVGQNTDSASLIFLDDERSVQEGIDDAEDSITQLNNDLSNLDTRLNKKVYPTSVTGLSVKDFLTIFIGNIYDDTTVTEKICQVEKTYAGNDVFTGMAYRVDANTCKMMVSSTTGVTYLATRSGSNVYCYSLTGSRIQ